MFKIKKKQDKCFENSFYMPEFKIKKEFNLNDLTNLIENQIFPRVQEDKQFMLEHGGDPDCFPSTFDFVIALCLNTDLSLEYLKTSRPDIICFTVMMLNDLLFTKYFHNTEIINLLNEYIASNANVFSKSDYSYVIDIMSDFVNVDDADVFERCFLPNYVDIDKCIAEVFSKRH